jgi:transglutaminase-like putative cysteine protease
MQRIASVQLELELAGFTNLVFGVAPASGATIELESLSISMAGENLEPHELSDLHEGRLHTLTAERGRMLVDYSVTVEGRADPAPASERDLVTYLRPSRYCQSDSLTPMARAQFGGLSGHNLLRAVTDWVASTLAYIPGSSLPTDGATRTLLSRQGVCRDYAHVTIAILRAMDVPARMVAVYAPGLSPMDFHAVTEAWVDGAWWVVDPTHLAPRQSLLRISTGRDAADTAWLTSNFTDLTVSYMSLVVTVDQLPVDNGTDLIQLG